MCVTLKSVLSRRKTFSTMQTRESICYDRKRKKKSIIKHPPLTQPTSDCFISTFAKTEQMSPPDLCASENFNDVNFNF